MKFLKKDFYIFRLFLICFPVLIFISSCVENVPPVSTPPDNNIREWKFAYMSDNKDAHNASGINDTTVKRFAEDMKQQGLSILLVGGDLIDGRGNDVPGLNAQYSEWFKAMQPVYDSGISVYAVPGNHEYWGKVADDCVTAWNESVLPRLPKEREDNPKYTGREYSFKFENAFFIGLNQNWAEKGDYIPNYYAGNNVDWIKSTLDSRDKKKQPHLFVYGHMPQFMNQYSWETDTDFNNREEFWNTIGKAGSKIYLTGHIHTYSRSLATTKDGLFSIHQIIVGSCGAGFENPPWDGVYAESYRIKGEYLNNDYEGYMIATVKGPDVKLEWRYYKPDEGFKVGDTIAYIQTPMP